MLAVGAHPDDVEIGVGGILLRHADAGHEVTILTLTGGEPAASRRTAPRSPSARPSCSARGSSTPTLQDTSVSEGGEHDREIKRVIDEIRPDDGLHAHARATSTRTTATSTSATLVAARGVPRVFCYQAPSTTVDFRPTRFVAIDEYLDRKLEVIHAYGSQVKVRALPRRGSAARDRALLGRFAQARYVEPLEVVRDSDVAGAARPTRDGTTGAPGGGQLDVG